jgi:hypothetical protein
VPIVDMHRVAGSGDSDAELRLRSRKTSPPAVDPLGGRAQIGNRCRNGRDVDTERARKLEQRKMEIDVVPTSAATRPPREQGFGEVMQIARFLPAVNARVNRSCRPAKGSPVQTGLIPT